MISLSVVWALAINLDLFRSIIDIQVPSARRHDGKDVMQTELIDDLSLKLF